LTLGFISENAESESNQKNSEAGSACAQFNLSPQSRANQLLLLDVADDILDGINMRERERREEAAAKRREILLNYATTASANKGYYKKRIRKIMAKYNIKVSAELQQVLDKDD